MAEEKKTGAAPKKTPAKKASAAKKPAAAAKKPAAKTSAKKTSAPAKAAAKAAPKKAAQTKAASRSAKADVPSSANSSATAKYVRVSPRKARLVVDKIRNKPVQQALDELAFIERACALDVEKVIRSAAANAYLEKGFRPEALVIEKAYVDEGPTIKRFRPRAKGAASRINKRTCHITVSVAARKEA